MKPKFLLFFAIGLMPSSSASGQTPRRWAIVGAHGPEGNAGTEERVTDELTAQLAGRPGITLVDRSSIAKVLREQNFQNSDRSSAETAARIGKLPGVQQMVLVQVQDFSYTPHTEQAGNKTRTTATVLLRANAKVIEVETGVLLAQPSGAFEHSAVVSEVSKAVSGFQIPIGGRGIPLGGKPATTSGGDPKVIEENERANAYQAVVQELAAKLTSLVPAAAPPVVESALVAGISNGSVVINRGMANGIKPGDRFQVTREVSLGLNDPETGKAMTKKERVCVLTIVDIDEKSSSGTCQGGLPQSRDVANPIR